MKQLISFQWVLLIVGSLLILPACKGNEKRSKDKQPTASAKDQIPADLAKAYRVDAARLAAREFNSTRRPGDPQVKLPQDRITYFYSLLSKAYLMMQADPAVPDLTYIHTFGTPDLHEVMVFLKPDADFAEAWGEGRTSSTPNLYVNQVMSENRLKIKEFNDSAMGQWAVIRSDSPINTKDLAFIFSQIDGVKMAEPNGMAGDGNDIRWTSGGKTGMALRFSKGWGDCPSGCIHRANWTFYVPESGEMTYQGQSGDDPKTANSEED